MSEAEKCNHINDKREKCNAWAMHDKEHCYRHDPNSRDLSLEASRRGGLAREVELLTPLEEMPINTSKDVVKLIATTINEVRTGKLDPRIANTIGFLAGHLIRAYEVAELEDKVEEVKAVLLERKPLKKG